jgi:hypothetical protein
MVLMAELENTSCFVNDKQNLMLATSRLQAIQVAQQPR